MQKKNSSIGMRRCPNETLSRKRWKMVIHTSRMSYIWFIHEMKGLFKNWRASNKERAISYLSYLWLTWNASQDRERTRKRYDTLVCVHNIGFFRRYFERKEATLFIEFHPLSLWQEVKWTSFLSPRTSLLSVNRQTKHTVLTKTFRYFSFLHHVSPFRLSGYS